MPRAEGRAQAIMDSFPPFQGRTDEETCHTYNDLDVLQVNVGRLCNLACRHCHMEAGPTRTEVMTRETLQQCLDVCVAYGFKVLDVTGGAPEMNPDFEWFIREAAARDIDTIVRSNLVVLQNSRYARLPEVFAELGVTVFASLPHYVRRAAERQRGDGTFDAIISMMRKLNGLGYGAGNGLVLNLVYNPGGAFLAPDQTALEGEYRRRLADDYGVTFDNLFAIVNNPLGRFGDWLFETGNLEGYMKKLVDSFNPASMPRMMCRNQLSVGWDGSLYDCDFNQAADIPCINGLTIADYARHAGLPLRRAIAFGNHCYACCAGAGSSCGGATT